MKFLAIKIFIFLIAIVACSDMSQESSPLQAQEFNHSAKETAADLSSDTKVDYGESFRIECDEISSRYQRYLKLIDAMEWKGVNVPKSILEERDRLEAKVIECAKAFEV